MENYEDLTPNTLRGRRLLEKRSRHFEGDAFSPDNLKPGKPRKQEDPALVEQRSLLGGPITIYYYPDSTGAVHMHRNEKWFTFGVAT